MLMGMTARGRKEILTAQQMPLQSAAVPQNQLHRKLLRSTAPCISMTGPGSNNKCWPLRVMSCNTLSGDRQLRQSRQCVSIICAVSRPFQHCDSQSVLSITQHTSSRSGEPLFGLLTRILTNISSEVATQQYLTKAAIGDDRVQLCLWCR